MMFLLSVCAYAQSETVSGVVTDENGEALVGATVKLKGSAAIAAITDIDGNYQIKVDNDKSVLIFSYLGYSPVEEKVGKKRIINVALSPDASTLEEVVVVAYGQQRKVSVVGAQSSMKMDDVRIPTGNLTSAIQGRIPGVVAVQRSGEPGHDDANIWIRGISTFTNQNYSPLVLVDGVERSFNNIDPEDIESFTVLKDASATAVYGVRGANGVILVTTKPGVVGKPQFTADYYEGWVTLVKKPKLADAYTYMDAANEASMNTSGTLAYTSQYIEATKKANGILPNDNPRMYNQYLYPAVNWMNELFRDTGRNRRLNMSVRGGVPNATYYASLSYYNETGLTRDAKMENYDGNIRYNRYNYTANINLKPTTTTKVDLGFNGYVASGNYPEQSPSTLFAAAMQINPTYLPLMMANGSIPGISSNGDFRNPYADLMCRGYRQENTSKLNSNIRVTQDFDFWEWGKGLSVSALLAFDVTNMRYLYYKKHDDTYYYAGSKDPETGLWNDDVFDENGDYRLNRTYQGHKELRYESAASELKSTYFEASINYNRAFGKHRVGGLFVYNQKNYNQSAGDLVGSLPYKQQGIAGRATYSWDDRYFFEFNIGYNGSENFSPKKRFGCFPAFGLGWAISNERFWQSISDYVPFFKIRYTDGKVGTDAVTNRRFMYLDQMASQDGYYFGVNNSLYG
ncbi:MAG: SusC/RagA family TonB-linked outer membrane protein, partial [Muribaculaceae bacterium]|nr:SusC/RagA family TonB-linked outer membrane protein [Muribaculaceae bacterium]